MSYKKKSSDELRKKPTKKTFVSSSKKYIQENKKSESDIFSSSDNTLNLNQYSSSSSKRKPMRRSMKILFNVLLSIVLVISSCGFVGVSLFEMDFKKEDIDQKETAEFELIKKSNNENVAYFLIAGVDLSENLTDIIMVACYDLLQNKLSILQIPRDTYIGDTALKINAVYGSARSGESKIKALIRCVNKRFGLPIDHYATITIHGTEKVIDAMGGVTVKFDRGYTLVDDSRKPEIKKYFPAGETKLDGQWATAFLRHRKSFAQGDLGRLKNQRSIYSAILKNLTSLNFSQITNIVKNCMDEISTDLTVGYALGYAEFAHKLKLDEVEIMTLPGQTATIAGQSCWVCHKQETLEMLNKYFVPYGDKLTLQDLEVVDYSERGSSYNNNYGEFLEGGTLNDFDKNKKEETTSSVQ